MDPLLQALISTAIAVGTSLAVLKFQVKSIETRLDKLEPEIVPLKVAITRIETKLDIMLDRMFK